MRGKVGKVLFSALVCSVVTVSVAFSSSGVNAQTGGESAMEVRRGGEAVGASIAYPEKLDLERDEYTYDGTYGYTLYEPETRASEDHGAEPAIRVARDQQMKPGQIRKEVRKTLDAYSKDPEDPEEIDVSSRKVKVGEQGARGTAVGPIPGETPYIEVYVPRRGEVYRIDLYGTELDAEARELLGSIRFSEPQRSIASLDLPTANSEEALYPKGGPVEELQQLSKMPKAPKMPDATDQDPVSEEPVGEAPAGEDTAGEELAGEEPIVFTTLSTSTRSSRVPTYRERRIYQGCWRANSRFWLQTQHDSTANAARGDGIRRGFTVVGRPNYWGQYTHGNLKGYGRCNSTYYTNDKFAVDYPYNRGDRIYSPFNGGKVVFAGQTRSHRGLGIFVVIRDDNGKYVSSSGHLSGLAPGIKRGVRVGKNTVIGYAGNSGSGSVPTGEVHNHQAFYRYPSYTRAGAPYGGRGLQTLYYHYAGTAARNGGGVYKLGWTSTSYQKAEGDRISN